MQEKIEKTSSSDIMKETKISSISSSVDEVTPPEPLMPPFISSSAPYSLEQQQLDAAELLKKLLQQNPNLIKQETEKLEREKTENEVIGEISTSKIDNVKTLEIEGVNNT